jgi:hypothetical protein
MNADILLRAAQHLDDAGVVWWVTDGTCLSLVRSGVLEPWQKDIDFGVWDIGVAREVLKSAGWPDLHVIRNQFKTSGMLDVSGHRREGDWVVVEYINEISYEFSARLFDSFGTVEALGRKFLTPNPVEDYLAEHYGEGWRTPVKVWQWDESPPCIR